MITDHKEEKVGRMDKIETDYEWWTWKKSLSSLVIDISLSTCTTKRNRLFVLMLSLLGSNAVWTYIAHGKETEQICSFLLSFLVREIREEKICSFALCLCLCFWFCCCYSYSCPWKPSSKASSKKFLVKSAARVHNLLFCVYKLWTLNFWKVI